MAGAFDGIRVVDFTTTIAGPHCTRMMADLGAEVIKVETPDGDMMRTRPPLRDGASAMFGQLNAGKHSVQLNLKSDADRRAAHKLIGTADVVVENYRPGVTRRLGIDYPTLAKDRADLIYCSISGYGQTGPSADKPAYAPVIHATSGFDLAHIAYQAGRERPDYCGIFVADVLAGTYAFGAIAAALAQRQATGAGQAIDVSMLEAMLSLTLSEMQGAQFEMPPQPSRPLFGPVETADGYVNIAVASERTFDGMAKAAGRMDWFDDPRFKVYIDRRVNWGALMDEFEVWSRTLPTEECLEILSAHNVPAAAYRTVREAMADPQLAHRDAFATVTDAGGPFRCLKLPFRFSNSDVATGPRVPSLGEDTRAVLAAAGLSDSEIDQLG